LQQLGVDVDVRVIEGHASRLEYARAALEMIRTSLNDRRYDVIHAHTGHCGVVAMLQLRHPVVVSYVGYDLEAQSADHRMLRALERFVFRNLSCLVAASIVKSRRGQTRLPPLGRRRAHLIPNGVDLDVFKPIGRDEARSVMGWGDEPTVLFPADPARPEKRFALARSAFELAQETMPSLRLALLADVDPDLVPYWMNAADVLILTSISEGSPNVVKEALACNLPVVSVDVGDVAEITSGVRLSHICRATSEALAASLLAVVSSLPERSDGREHIARLSTQRVAGRLIDVYGRAALRGPGPLGFLQGRRSVQGVAELER
jgi:glycosyltransferase involved in cell wall biosynthesis